MARSPLISWGRGGASAPFVPRFAQPGAARRPRASAKPGQGLPQLYWEAWPRAAAAVAFAARVSWDGAEAALACVAGSQQVQPRRHADSQCPGAHRRQTARAGAPGAARDPKFARLGGTEASRGLGGPRPAARENERAGATDARGVSPIRRALEWSLWLYNTPPTRLEEKTRQAKLGY